MQAVILCGGKGTRLRPLTNLIPKPLLPLGNTSALDLLLSQLARHGFEQVILAVGPHRRLIEAFAGNGHGWGLELDYCEENEPLGTAGALTAIGDLSSHFVVVNGDVLCELDFGAFLRRHIESEAELTIAVTERETRLDLGVLKLSADNVVEDYQEKPQWTHAVSAGIYAVSRPVLAGLPERSYLDFPVLVRRLLEQKRRVVAERLAGRWLDIGRPEDFEQARREVGLRRLMAAGTVSVGA